MNLIMTVGEKTRFAIESFSSQTYARLSFRALGYFVLYIAGHRYGKYSPDATMLACSFDEVQRRIAGCGKHVAPFAKEEASKIATAFGDAIYARSPQAGTCFGISQEDFKTIIYKRHIAWAPDGDEAFDDGSFVLQFDVLNQVRLIAFRFLDRSACPDPLTLKEVWMESDVFYDVLKQWAEAFEAEWASSEKVRDK